MTTTEVDAVERLESALARLEALGLIAPDLQAATPPHVVAGELIEASWGNAVVDELTEHESRITTIEPGDLVYELTATSEVQIFSGGTIAPIGSFTAPATGAYLIDINAYARTDTTNVANMSLAVRAGGQVGYYSTVALAANTGTTLPLRGRFNLNAGVNSVDVQGFSSAGPSNFVGGRIAHITKVRAGN